MAYRDENCPWVVAQKMRVQFLDWRHDNYGYHKEPVRRRYAVWLTAETKEGAHLPRVGDVLPHTLYEGASLKKAAAAFEKATGVPLDHTLLDDPKPERPSFG